MKRSEPDDLLLGEWACLGALYPSPMHGFAVAALLAPDASIGRVWSLSRPLTYRSLDQLEVRGLIAPIGREPGSAGPNRTVLAATRTGRSRLRAWVREPVEHLRDLRSELILKLVLAKHCGIELNSMLAVQLEHTRLMAEALSSGSSVGGQHDPVMLWRSESANAAVRFLERLQEPHSP